MAAKRKALIAVFFFLFLISTQTIAPSTVRKILGTSPSHFIVLKVHLSFLWIIDIHDWKKKKKKKKDYWHICTHHLRVFIFVMAYYFMSTTSTHENGVDMVVFVFGSEYLSSFLHDLIHNYITLLYMWILLMYIKYYKKCNHTCIYIPNFIRITGIENNWTKSKP